MADRKPGQKAELHGLLGHAEGARDHRLRGDDRRGGRQHHHRDLRPAREQQIERVGDRLRGAQYQRSLGEVVEGERREHDQKPCAADRRAPEMTHVRVQRLGARHRQHHRRERDERDAAVRGEELHPVARRQRAQDAGVVRHLHGAHHAEHAEPDDHHRPEQVADNTRAEALNREQHAEDRHRDRQHERVQARHRDLQPFHRGEHRDRRGDHAVAVEQRGAGDPERDQRRRHHRAAAAPRRLQQRRQRHDAALAAVVGAHDERDVLDRHHQRDRPEHERDHAVDVPLRGVHRVIIGSENRLQRVQRTGPDVAEHHSQRTERERRHRGSRGGVTPAW